MKYLLTLLLLILPVVSWAGTAMVTPEASGDPGYLRAITTGDTLVKTGAGVLHSYVCWGSDAAATAGDIAIRDGVAAAGGTIMIDYLIAAAALVPTGQTSIDIPFSTGLYLDYTTTADVTCVVSYR